MGPGNSCRTCKTRRIKCDNGQPICQRCIKSHRTCVRDGTSPLSIISENKYAAGAVKRPRGPRIPRHSVQHIALTNLRTRALEYYFRHHLEFPQTVAIDITGSLSACVFTWRQSGNTSAMVDLALASMALAVYARTQASKQAAAEAFTSYQELLRVTQEEIARPVLEAASVDACLLTVFLMGRCESTMHRAGELDPKEEFMNIKSWSHHDGALALLNLWYAHLRGANESTIVKQTRRGLLKSLLLRARPVPQWLQDGADFGEVGLELDHDHILARLVNLRHAVDTIHRSSEPDFSQELLTESLELMHSLTIFESHLLSIYPHQSYEVSLADQKQLQTQDVYVCSKIIHTATWSHVFATNLLINYTSASIVRLSDKLETEVATYEAKVQDAMNNFVATIPHCLTTIKIVNKQVRLIADPDTKPYQASLVVWPLTLVTSIKWSNSDQQQNFKNLLVRLGATLGDGVLQAADTDMWDSLQAR